MIALSHDDYVSNDDAIERLVRAVFPWGANAAMYAVMIAAAKAAVTMTSVQADGLVHEADALGVLRQAIRWATAHSRALCEPCPRCGAQVDEWCTGETAGGAACEL